MLLEQCSQIFLASVVWVSLLSSSPQDRISEYLSHHNMGPRNGMRILRLWVKAELGAESDRDALYDFMVRMTRSICLSVVVWNSHLGGGYLGCSAGAGCSMRFGKKVLKNILLFCSLVLALCLTRLVISSFTSRSGILVRPPSFPLLLIILPTAHTSSPSRFSNHSSQ